MKRSISIILIAVVCVLSTSTVSFAQENGNRDAQGKVVRGPYATNAFGDNWFIGAGGGASIYIGGYNQSFSGRIRPTIDFNFGKWFTPSIGARVDFNIAPLYREKYNGSWHKFTYWGLHADFLWNLSNALGGYKETRVYQVIPFVGGGYAQTTGTSISHVSHAFILDAGIINKFRVSNRIDLNLEIAASGCPQSLDQLRQSNKTTIDVPLSVVAGITIKLGKTNFQRVSSVVKASNESLNKELAKFQKELEDSKSANEKLQAENDALKAQPKAAAVVTTNTVEKFSQKTFVTMYFEIGRSVLSDKELANLETYMHNVSTISGNNGKKTFHIIGAADKATGSHETNMRLSKERANYVKNILVNKYNVPSDNISIEVAGDNNNHFDTPYLNRTATLFITIE